MEDFIELELRDLVYEIIGDDMVGLRYGPIYDIIFRKSRQLLVGIENKGMLPPAIMLYKDIDNGNTLCSESCTWDSE